ncbi:hypothetical protein QR680_003779 [Steinernema hermaphroditum]|uniref:Uncharacterized protein n=1 Tax=Steinernema hermaphroditum TaxID=289476 RepID=A0AA39HLJ0_9BILA|nr:hypothetical protein QR680_003779 [Steinernema hermaphroditum]
MSEAATLYIIYTEVGLCLVTIFFNTLSFASFAKRRNLGGRHMTMLTVKVAFDVLFALAALGYCGAILRALYGSHEGIDETIFWTGNVFHSLEISMAVLNFFIGLDRYLAVNEPLRYVTTYGPRVQRASILKMMVLYFVFFIFYAATEQPRGTFPHMFSQFANAYVTYYLYCVICAIFVANIAISVLFLVSFWKFLKKRSPDAGYTKNLHAANKIVICNLLIELIVLVIPTVFTSSALIFFKINLPDRFGPYTQALYVAYTAISSIAKRPLPPPPPTGRSSSYLCVNTMFMFVLDEENMKNCVIDSMTSMWRLAYSSRWTVWNEQRRIFSTSACVDCNPKRDFASWYGERTTQQQLGNGPKNFNDFLADLKVKYLQYVKTIKSSQSSVKIQNTVSSSSDSQQEGALWTMFWRCYDTFEEKTSFATLYVIYVAAITAITLTIVNFASLPKECDVSVAKSQESEHYLSWDKSKELREELKTKQKELYKLLRTKDSLDTRVEQLQKEIQLLKQQKPSMF